MTTFNDDPDLLKNVITGTNNGCMAINLKPKRIDTIEEIKEKSKQELLAFIKKRISEVFRGLDETLA